MNKLNKLAIKSQAKLSNYINRAKALMADKTGSLTIEQMLLILGALAIVAILVGLVILFIKNEFWPDFIAKAKSIMNMS